MAIPDPIKEILATHLAKYVDNQSEALVFMTGGKSHIWITNFRKGVWWPALEMAGTNRIVTIKDLRHKCAS